MNENKEIQRSGLNFVCKLFILVITIVYIGLFTEVPL